MTEKQAHPVESVADAVQDLKRMADNYAWVQGGGAALDGTLLPRQQLFAAIDGFASRIESPPSPAAQPDMRELVEAARKGLEALENAVEEKADYMRLNHLGDPETTHTVKWGRIAIAALRSALEKIKKTS